MNVIIPLNPFAWFILIALLLDNFKSFVLINYRVRKKAFSFFMFSSLNAILNFGFGLLFVASFKWGVEGRMLAPIISSFMLLPFAIYILLKFSTISFNFNLFLKAAKISIPLVLAAYAYVPIASIDRFYLERLNNLSELGLYNIGVTIAGYVQLAFIALTSAIEPDIFKGVANNDNKLLLKSALITFVPYFLISGVFILFSGIIISVLTAGRYIDAEKYANITMISVFLMGIYWFSEKIFIALEKTKINLVINIIGGVFSVIIIYFAVQNFQFIGAAYGKVIVAFLIIMVQFILIYFNLKQKIPTHK
jgi:O-antigen/teichoic acid export membrane protein